MNISKLILISLLSLCLGACVSSNSGSVYKRDEVRKTQTVKTGIVESVRTVRLEGTRSPVGTIAGTVIGGVAGGSVGSGGRTSTVISILGSIVGGIVGSAAEEVVTRENGLELTINLDGGGLVTIVQEDDEAFAPGDKVRIIQSGSVSRVSH